MMHINKSLKEALILEGYDENIFKDETSEGFIDFLETMILKKPERLTYFVEQWAEPQFIRIIPGTPGDAKSYFLQVGGNLFHPFSYFYVKEGEFFREAYLVSIKKDSLLFEIRAGFKTILDNQFNEVKIFKK